MPWTNLVLLYNGNISDQAFGTARLELRDFQTKSPVGTPRNFVWSQLKPGGGVFRWHFVVTLIIGRDYEIRITRLGRQSNWTRFKAPANQSVSFYARKLKIW